MLGVFFIAAEYTKCALGFVQLASMAELTIVVRQSVSLMLSSRKQQQQQTQSSRGSMVSASQADCSQSKDKIFKRYLLILYISCSLCSLLSLGIGTWQATYTLRFVPNINRKDIQYLIISLTKASNTYFGRQARFSCALLGIVSSGLIVSYVLLICAMCKYFREQMQKEIVRLTCLFATFVFSYFLRFIYEIGLMCGVYEHWIPDEIVRWKLVLFLPLLWDLTSILSILVLHFQSFRDKIGRGALGGHRNGFEQHDPPTSLDGEGEIQTMPLDEEEKTSSQFGPLAVISPKTPRLERESGGLLGKACMRSAVSQKTSVLSSQPLLRQKRKNSVPSSVSINDEEEIALGRLRYSHENSPPDCVTEPEPLIRQSTDQVSTLRHSRPEPIITANSDFKFGGSSGAYVSSGQGSNVMIARDAEAYTRNKSSTVVTGDSISSHLIYKKVRKISSRLSD